MKKITTVLVATSLIALNSFAQKSAEGFSKGNVILSGSIGFGTEKQDQAKTNVFSINPKVGYFISNNLAVGINVGFASLKDETGNTINENTTATTLGVFGRYYFTPGNKFSFFGNLGVDYVSKTNKLTDPDLKVNGFNVAVSPGINYFLSKNLAIESSFGLLGFSSEKADIDGAKAKNSFGFNVGLTSVNFGLVYKF